MFEILAAIYVTICGLQLAFTVWRDLKETSRRTEAQGLNRKYAEEAKSSNARFAAAIEGIQRDLAENYLRRKP